MENLKVVNVIFIGEKFYFESGTIMSSIYELTDNKYERTDWGKVQINLQKGVCVNIRPANEEELNVFNKQLDIIKDELANIKKEGE